MKIAKKILSFLIAIVILISGTVAFPVTALENDNQITAKNENLSVSGTNSTGNLIANALSDVQEEQEESSGYTVFSATVEENVVQLAVETLEDCTVVVAIYNEAGTQLITTGYSSLRVGETSAIVVLEAEEMPQYFYLRAFLVDTNTFRPISTSYECPNYTQEMQEFLAKTIEDFETEKVVSFDESIDNNFAVYDDSTIIIPEDSSGNDVAFVDNETCVYVIENIDESIASLVEGDIFAYEYNDQGDILIVKVAKITIDGTTATIEGEETTLEEVFEYVKIDSTAGVQESELDTTEMDEGLEYNGKVDVEDNGDSRPTYAVDIEGSLSQAFSYKLYKKEMVKEENKEVEFKASLNFGIAASVKVYISLKYQYVELKLTPTVELTGELSGKWNKELALAKVKIPVITGVNITVTPKLVFEVSGKIAFSAKLEVTIGGSVSSDEGVKDLTSTPKITVEADVEAEIFFGLRIEAKTKLISDKIGRAEIGGQVGGTVTIAPNVVGDAIHLCTICMKGDIKAVAGLDLSVSLLNDKVEWSQSFEIEAKVGNFYLSNIDGFNTGTCDNIYYKTIVEVVDGSGKVLSGAIVSIDMYTVAENVDASKIKNKKDMTLKSEHTTNKKGQVIGYLSNGSFNAQAQKDNYSGNSKAFVVKDSSKSTQVQLFDNNTNLSNTVFSQVLSAKTYATYEDELYVTKDVYAVIDNNGRLYMWGETDRGHFGTGDFSKYSWDEPKQVLSDVFAVDIGEYAVGAIKSNGDLYTWGSINGQASTPTKKDGLSKVVQVSMGVQNYAAVTQNGDLYMWGQNNNILLNIEGEGSTISKPQKIMTGVAKVCLNEEMVMVVTQNGDLYTWGSNENGELGDGTAKSRKTPKKIMSGVKDVAIGDTVCAAIKNDGSLYTWGYGVLGTGESKLHSKVTPQKIMSNVKSIDIYGGRFLAITNTADLYIWGTWFVGTYFNVKNGLSPSLSTPKCALSNVVSMAASKGGEIYAINKECKLISGRNKNNGKVVLYNAGNPPSANMVTQNYSNMSNTFASTFEEEITPDVIETTPTEKTAEFTGLLANEVYNFYVMKDRKSELPFDANNLLYMTQCVSDADGNLSITYTPTAESEITEIFVKGMTKIDITKSSTLSHNIVYNRTENRPVIDIVCGGEFLENGLDYEFAEGEAPRDVGEYTVTIVGTGDYIGSIEVSYKIYCGHEYCTGTCVMCGEQKGDIDGDGQFNENDYAMLLNISAAGERPDNEEICDLNGDGAIDTFDAMILDLRNSGTLKSRAIGDANGDGIINESDYTLLFAVISGEESITETISNLCDINRDGIIGDGDLLLLEKYLNGEYQIEQKYA